MAGQNILFLIIAGLSFITFTTAQYEDKRCICICPDPAVVNASQTATPRKIYKIPVAPSKCDCENVVLPNIGEGIKGKEKEFCPRCECRYESRNTTTIEVVVIFVIWILSLLVLYMVFLLCLDPMLNKRRAMPMYREQTNEDETIASARTGMSQPLRLRNNVIGRVTHQQDKWKKQVEEQRRNIYDRHTMLN